MNAADAIKYLLKLNQQILESFLSDLSDADLLVRPTPGGNHAAWQLGHLISTEAGFFLPMIPGAAAVPLPEGFAKQHSKETATQAGPAGFKSKAEYLALFDKVRAATTDAVDQLTEADLDKPTDWEMANTVGKVLIMVGNHDMMHGGQLTVLRRKLGKPVLF